MKLRLFLLFALFNCAFAFSQTYKKHKVAKGETISSIAREYKITPYDIFRLNPDAKNGITPDMVLLLPSTASSGKTTGTITAPVKESPSKVVNTVHNLQEGETFYSLSKKYNVTVDAIKKANPDISLDDLQIGQGIVIPIENTANATDVQVKKAEKIEGKPNQDAYVYHTVMQGETKYSIAKEYDMTLQLLEELNPEVKDVLPIGYNLKLVNRDVVSNQPITDITVVTPKQDPNYMVYVVRAKETFYNLGKKTGLTEEEIIALNPEAKDGLKEGMKLKLPKAEIAAPLNSESNFKQPIVARPFTDLTQSLNKAESKELVLLLPFNTERVQQDTVRSQLLRKDRFLNITLDFYSGALMAIDSAKVLGLPLHVKIYDSKESKNSSAVSSLRNKLTSADAVVGPFFPANVETTASMLSGTPVISPFSKEHGSQYTNLFQTVPSSEYSKKMLFDYLVTQKANVLAVVDAKKLSSRQYIKHNYPSVKIVGQDADGKVAESALKSLLVKGSKNYIILETERIETAISITKILEDATTDYSVQLVVPENTDMMENAEIPIERLVALKMMYASVTNDSKTVKDTLFEKAYRLRNGYNPNQFATRGFDVTFDVILRMFQEQSLNTMLDSVATEQVKNKFAYKKENGGHYNTGVYLLHYDEGMIVKEITIPVVAKPVEEVDETIIEETFPFLTPKEEEE